jgi:hypothetical protein
VAALAAVSAGPQHHQKVLHTSTVSGTTVSGSTVSGSTTSVRTSFYTGEDTCELHYNNGGTSHIGVWNSYRQQFTCPEYGQITEAPSFHAYGRHNRAADLSFIIKQGPDCPTKPAVSFPVISFIGKDTSDFNFFMTDEYGLPTDGGDGGALGNEENPVNICSACNTAEGDNYAGPDGEACAGDATIVKMEAMVGTSCCQDWQVIVEDNATENGEEDNGWFVHWSLKLPGCSHVQNE